MKLVWSNAKLTTARDMLKDLRNVIEIDLSKFDSSEITDMNFMFQRDHSLTSINLNNFNTTKVKRMECMFYECIQLTELDLSSFDTSNVEEMRLMFFGCQKLISLNIESFETSNVLNMEYLFFQCFALQSFSIRNFDTSKVQKMNYMFFQCNSLTSLDLTNFKTNSLIEMDNMFSYSEWLSHLDITSFDTSHVIRMKGVFEGCKSLTSLNLSNFDTSEVIYMDGMFKGCENLKSLDLSNFHTPNLQYINEAFTNCKSLISLEISNFVTNQVVNMESLFTGCNSLYSLNISNFNSDLAIILKNMFKDCDYLNYINFQLYKDRDEADRLNDILVNTPQNMVICINEDDTTEKLQQIIYEKICPTIYCGYNWKSKQKKILPNNTCVENNIIDSSEPHIIESTELKETTNSLQSTELINESTILIKESTEQKKELTSEITESNSENISTQIHNNQITLTEETFEYSTIKINVNISNFTSDDLNKMIYENITNNLLQNFMGKEIVIEGENNFLFRMVTNENMFQPKNNETKKLSLIDLGDCESKLRQKYELNENISLIILSMEKDTEISSERNVQFEVYESLNKTRLNLDICQDTPIDIYIPLILSEELTTLYNELKDLGYNLFDSNDKFYNDICTPYKSQNGTDVLLSDRKKYF